MWRHAERSLILVVLLLCGACVSTEPSASSFSVQRATVPDADPVFRAAAATLVDHGFRLDVADKQTGRLMTYPSEFRRDNESPRFGAAKSGRRVAEIRLQHAGDEATVYCRVIVQRQTTEAHRLLAVDGSGDDRPQQTPIERDAATARTQNTVWQTVGRDKSQERAILADVLAQLVAPTAPVP